MRRRRAVIWRMVTALAVAAVLFGPVLGEAHIVVYKVCLDKTVEADSTSMLMFERRPQARKAGTYAWNALTADEFGGRYADFHLSNKSRTLCAEAEAGGFVCALSGIPCREIDSCEEAGSRWCYEVER